MKNAQIIIFLAVLSRWHSNAWSKRTRFFAFSKSPDLWKKKENGFAACPLADMIQSRRRLYLRHLHTHAHFYFDTCDVENTAYYTQGAYPSDEAHISGSKLYFKWHATGGCRILTAHSPGRSFPKPRASKTWGVSGVFHLEQEKYMKL